MSNTNEIMDFLNEISPSTETTNGSFTEAPFNDAQAGVPQMGPPLVTVTVPEEDGVEAVFPRGKLVYYAQGGRKFFGYYSEMKVVRDGNTITFTGTLNED
tara:strand:- start:354 stop:653 length:300 start_codon:yes stop_codon:yes gene_type:complete